MEGRAHTSPPQSQAIAAVATEPLPPVAVERRAEDPLHRLRAFVGGFDGRVLLLAESAGRRETMQEYFAEHGLKATPAAGYAEFALASEKLMLSVAPLHAGFILTADRVAVITENELYAQQVRQRTQREAKRLANEYMLRDLSEVKVGDPVVHEQHGIGRYLGLQTMDLGEGETEFLTLEYAGGDKLYVPVSQLHLISRYSGAAPEQAPLHTLGSGQWEKAKRKAAAQVRDTAAELLNLYAQRASRHGYAFEVKQHDYEAFAETFPFEETADQASAINATLEDLKSGKPMDRLVCGDVGFGKTEVALRAAFVAVADGKQVAVLVPTTLLAEQHFNTFSDRFADWPVKIAELSRFRNAQEQAESLRGIAEGRIDIAIGTHKLLQGSVKFKNLGLVIIDEEHRFGVRQKERLKALRAEVDVLTLTATPIPRTLAMSLEGLRDFSVIATAPQRRLAIKTFVSRFSRPLIREAVLRELKRGGLVYFLHNDIDTIGQMEETHREARSGGAHPRRPRPDARARARARHARLLPAALQSAALHDDHRDRHRRADREHDHHQPRRSLRPGAAAPAARARRPLAPPGVRLPAAARGRQRHDAGQEAARSDPDDGRARLGLLPRDARPGDPRRGRSAGRVAERRNAGGRIQPLLLDARCGREVAQAGQGAGPRRAARESPPRSICTCRRLLPGDYVTDVHERLVLYKRLANCDTEEELDLLREELVDRFGPLPEQVRALVDTHRLRILGKPLGIARIDATDSAVCCSSCPIRRSIQPRCSSSCRAAAITVSRARTASASKRHCPTCRRASR